MSLKQEPGAAPTLPQVAGAGAASLLLGHTPVATPAPASAQAAAPAQPVLPSAAAGSMRVVVLDNGGDTCKFGFAGEAAPRRLIPNCAVRPKKEKKLYVGDQIPDNIIDFQSLFYKRPVERGYVTNWKLESHLWGRIFSKPSNKMNINPREHGILITEPPFNPKSIQKSMDEIVFEKHGFMAFYRTCPQMLACQGFQREHPSFGVPCALVVDSGFSFTHAVPLFHGKPLSYAIRRVNVGGKLLTNLLKETVSYRAWNMMDETHLMNQIKEKLCYVSLDFLRDLRSTKKKSNSIVKEYVLPNGSTRFEGYVKGEGKPPPVKGSRKRGGNDDEDQCLVMNGERISIPEVLFRPSDTGLNQAGVAEAVVAAVQACPKELQALMYGNILLTGGNTKFKNYAARLEQEVRALASDEFEVKIVVAPDPITTAWVGGSLLGASAEFSQVCVTRKEYQEYGQSICSRKFLNSSTA